MRVLFLGILAAILMTGCQAVDKLTQFNVPYSTNFTIPATSGITLPPLNIVSPTVSTNIEQTYSNNNTKADLIEEVNLTSLEMTLTSPSGSDFSFLKNVTIYINADGVGEQEIASKNPVPAAPGSKITFDVTGVDLKEYIKADEFTLRISAEMDQHISQPHEVKADMVFKVDAKVLGV